MSYEAEREQVRHHHAVEALTKAHTTRVGTGLALVFAAIVLGCVGITVALDSVADSLQDHRIRYVTQETTTTTAAP